MLQETQRLLEELRRENSGLKETKSNIELELKHEKTKIKDYNDLKVQMSLLRTEKDGLEKQIQDMCSNPWFGGAHLSAYENTETQLKSKDNESKVIELRRLLGEKEKKISDMTDKIVELESKVMKQVED